MMFENVNGTNFDDIDLKDSIYEKIEGYMYFTLENSDRNMFVPRGCIESLIVGKLKERQTISEEVSHSNEVTENPTEIWRNLLKICQVENKTYEGWRDICFILPSGKAYENLFCEWCKVNYAYYDEDVCREQFKKTQHIGCLGAMIKKARFYDEIATNDLVNNSKKASINSFVEGGNVGCAKIFYSKCKDNLIYKNGSWYQLSSNGRWLVLDKHNNGLINLFHDSVYPIVKQMARSLFAAKDEDEDEDADADDDDANADVVIVKDEEEEEDKSAMNKVKEFIKIIKRIKEVKFQSDCIKYACKYFNKSDIEFDNNPYLVGFNNGVWDFSEGVCLFRNYRFDDYMTMTVGYDWNEQLATDNAMNDFLNGLINEILGEKDVVDCFILSLARCLMGINSQKFIILNGTGGNGKGILCKELGTATFGEYAYNLPTSALTDGKKGGCNTELARR